MLYAGAALPVKLPFFMKNLSTSIEGGGGALAGGCMIENVEEHYFDLTTD